MEFVLTHAADGSILKLSGHLTYIDAPKFPSVLDVFSEVKTSCTIDLQDLDFIDSTGISLLIGISQAAAEADIPLCLNHAHGSVAHVLENVLFETLVPQKV